MSDNLKLRDGERDIDTIPSTTPFFKKPAPLSDEQLMRDAWEDYREKQNKMCSFEDYCIMSSNVNYIPHEHLRVWKASYERYHKETK